MRIQQPLFYLLLLSLCTRAQGYYCPSGTYRGSAFSGRLVAGIAPTDIHIDEEKQLYFYNFSMPFQLENIPSVAIAVHDFEFQPSKHIFYYIKHISTNSISSILFAIRIQWQYTEWKQISFSFLAEDRNDLESGYYLVDSGQLSSCKIGKSIQTLLPFRTQFKFIYQIRHQLFLHGFEISTSLVYNKTRSPFQIQILSSFADERGITVTLSVTTQTQVNSILLSFIAYQQINLSIMEGKFIYDSSISGSNLHHLVQNKDKKSYSRIFGITGFIINYHTQKIIFSTKWDGSSFIFNFGTANRYVKYLSYQYLFFIGSGCSNCPGYQILYNNMCVTQCPFGTSVTSQSTCISCGQGRYFNGTVCVRKCLYGNDSSKCSCPNNQNWDGQNCIACSSGKLWNKITNLCQCTYPFVWNGFNCKRFDQCQSGKVWDPYLYNCTCPQYFYWDGKQCQKIPICQGGQILDSNNYVCKCPKNQILIQNQCRYTSCSKDQLWIGGKCICPLGLNFNGSICIKCKERQRWNEEKKLCQCSSGYSWNGRSCQKIIDCQQNGRKWNDLIGQCVCPQKTYWAGFKCMTIQNCGKGQYFDVILSKCQCIQDQFWNGEECVECLNGKVWNKITKSCNCPQGTRLQGGLCNYNKDCKGGRRWVQYNQACQCPLKTQWNGTYCSSFQCQSGKYWDSSLKNCQCYQNFKQINGICLPQQLNCTNKRIWNRQLYICQCPPGTYFQNQKCLLNRQCLNGKIYNHLNNLCECPLQLKQLNGNCSNPQCQKFYFWNGFECQQIVCLPPFYFFQGQCIQSFDDNCGHSRYRNGKNCYFYSIDCPSGTNWTNFYCESVSKCRNGQYFYNQTCLPFPQKCIGSSTWNGSHCSSGKSCPSRTYKLNEKCIPILNCNNGYFWDTKLLKCVCPEGTINNGLGCIQCLNGKKYQNGEGCQCPIGQFNTGAFCSQISQAECISIPNSQWKGQKCVCQNGFRKLDLNCICQGVIINSYCDRCAHRLNSIFKTQQNSCICKPNYILIKQKCIPINKYQKKDDPLKCSVGSFYQMSTKMCLPCPQGCLSCFNSYKCNICQPQYYFDHRNDLCFQLCGDGKKFTVGCDDGNNIDGDGCSRDCQVQPGYICLGGSPYSKDLCFINKPKQIYFVQKGQIRRKTSITVLIQLNYFPKSILFSTDCNYKCSKVLLVNVKNGDQDIKYIKSQLQPGKNNIFLVKIQFGRNLFGKFTLEVGLNPSIAKHFNHISFLPLNITVQPRHLLEVNQF